MYPEGMVAPMRQELTAGGIEEARTAADVDRVARKYVHPDNLAILVVGNPKDFDKSLSTFGKVTPIDINIPPPTPGK